MLIKMLIGLVVVVVADDFGPALTPELREAEDDLRARAPGRRQS